MGAKGVTCLNGSSGKTTPYTVYEIPTGLDKRVVNAGSKYDSAVIFAGKVTTHDENGGLVREFEKDDYRRLDRIYGVQFASRDTERFVLIQADPTLIGDQVGTVETGSRRTWLSPYKPNPDGSSGYANADSDGRSFQQNFIRTYSFNGETAMQVVFPKQKK